MWWGRCAWQRGGVHGRRDSHCSGWHTSYRNAFLFLPPAMKLGQGYIFTGICHSVNGGYHPSMHCRWYPSMPCSRSPGGSVPGGRGLLLWSCVMPFWFGGLLIGRPSGMVLSAPPRRPPHQKAITEGGAWWRHPPRTATTAGGTHPTGMHSCKN